MRNLIIAAAVIVLAGGAWFLMAGSDDDAAEETTISDVAEDATEGTVEEAAESYTAAEVATHNTAEDCWTIMGFTVYDITEYIPNHPGGEEILRACGTDGTSLFLQRTTSEGETVGTGTGHSPTAAALLEGFLIGDLAEL